jgi:hypothetical protein
MPPCPASRTITGVSSVSPIAETGMESAFFAIELPPAMAITPQAKNTAPAIIFLFGFLIVILLKIIFNKKYACNGADMRGRSVFLNIYL